VRQCWGVFARAAGLVLLETCAAWPPQCIPMNHLTQSSVEQSFKSYSLRIVRGPSLERILERM
jgi:hypothetical protein